MSNKPEKDVPVRIVKKKGHHGGHHGGAWKVAYADFVTAMMALFIVLWILAQGETVTKAVASYFKDPGAFETTRGSVLPDVSGNQGNTPVQINPLDQQKAMLQAMANSIRQELAKLPDYQDLAKQVDIQIVKEGLRFELLETPDSFYFAIGTANLNPEKMPILATITGQISKIPNKVVLEGHTDSRQYPSALGYTNFELSADRANAARRFMVAKGFPPDQIEEVRGYADSRLRNTGDPLDASNRRISILIKFQETLVSPINLDEAGLPPAAPLSQPGPVEEKR